LASIKYYTDFLREHGLAVRFSPLFPGRLENDPRIQIEWDTPDGPRVVNSYSVHDTELILEGMFCVVQKDYLLREQVSITVETDCNGMVKIFTTTANDEVVAFARTARCLDGSVYIWKFRVEKPFRRKGIGKQLLSRVLQEFTDQTIRLNVNKNKLIAQHLYKSAGFKEDPENNRGDQLAMELRRD
jgi:ribosomal protein S18 acetylase RimI-like enzyme